MGIIELYSDKPNTIWKNSETFLCVFDNENNLISDYDFRTGLKLVQDEKKMTIYIADSDLVPGKWILFATKVFDEELEEAVRVEGKKDGEPREVVFNDKRPWDWNYSSEPHVSRQEREDRLSVCKSCPFFNIEDMKCEVDGKMVLETTKNVNGYCPEEKWGDKKRIDMERLAENLARGDIILPKGPNIDKEDQAEFENELEEYLKGL
jgi:hypothetical protein